MEKINIAKLLKDCPKGMKLYSPLCGECTFDNVSYGTIICKRRNCHEITFTSEGCYMIPIYDDCECVLFPSKENRDWSTFQRPFKDGDVVFFDDNIAIFKEWGDKTLFRTYVKQYIHRESIDIDYPLFGKYVRKETRLATEEEREKLFKAIKDNGYKWNPETKTLERLIVPKFKVGDRIKSKNSYTNYLNDNHIFTITEIRDGRYWSNRLAIEYISEQDNWELVHDKFDITTLKPFESRVLVRTDDRKWVAAFYSHYDKEVHLHHCVVGGLWYEQCIPYNDETKHLLDTTEECYDYYKTWK